jgi:glutamate-5-semialdehyde dehydrogenase
LQIDVFVCYKVLEHKQIMETDMSKYPELIDKARAAKVASRDLALLKTDRKNAVLQRLAELLLENAPGIIKANTIDVNAARESGMKEPLVDRLSLDDNKIKGMAGGLEVMIDLNDPVGSGNKFWVRPNGLQIMQTRVPFGVIAIIYESRPNVTVDTFGLALKSGNSILLRGSRSAINSNKELVRLIKQALGESGVSEDSAALVEAMEREVVDEMLTLTGCIDLVVPRGSQGLIDFVVKNTSIPVIETGVGNCHIFVDESADLESAVDIIINAKCQRPGVCNATESLLVHSSLKGEFLTRAVTQLQKNGVEVRGDKTVQQAADGVKPATADDWGTEYLDLIISIKTVDSVDEAIEHINRYSSKHTESILSNDYENIRKFTSAIDSAAVFVNASTRFTDGGEFGFGAEMGISTQKLHVRGPMGLEELTTTKYVIYGEGQIR